MNFRDYGIIISKYLLQEQYFLVSVFTEKHGIYSGIVRRLSAKKNINCTEGNLVYLTWRARLTEHVGYASVEPIKSFSSYLLPSKTKLYAFNSVVSLLKLAFAEREAHNKLFPHLLSFLENMRKPFCFKQYINLELQILAEAGYALQLHTCGATGSQHDLCYVSPKSGNAISKQAGIKYANKLLNLPRFLLSDEPFDNSESTDNSESIQEALRLTSYFLYRYVLANKASKAREDFISHILNQ